MEPVTNGRRRKLDAAAIFVIGLVGLAVFRAWFNTVPPLTGEEAYYWAWSRQLDFCYFDHPPLIAWTIRLFTAVLGDTVFAVRFAALCLHTATAVLVFLIAKRVFQDNVIASWAGGLFTTAVFFAGTATFMVPDSVLFFFWALAVWTVLWAVQSGKRRLWIVVGIVLGACALAKFHSILLAVAIGLFLLMSPRQRQTCRSGWLYLGALAAALMTIPILWWNAENDWVTFGFQLAGRHKWRLGSPTYFLEMIGAPFGYVGLLAFPLCVAGVVWGWRQWRRKGRQDLLLLVLACATPFIFFLILSVFIKIDPQWAAPAFITGVVLAAGLGVELTRRRSRWKRHLLSVAVSINAFLIACGYALGIVLMACPSVVPTKSTQLLRHRRRTRTEQLNRAYGWPEIGRRLREEIDLLPGSDRVFMLCASGYCTAASLRFYVEGHPAVHLIEDTPGKKHQFMIWERRANLDGNNAVAVLREKGDKERMLRRKAETQDWLRRHFDPASVEETDPIEIRREGRLRQKYLLYHARNFTPAVRGITPADRSAAGRE